MTKLLLDFPWQLDSVFDPNSNASYALHNFRKLCERENIQSVKFVSVAEYIALLDHARRRAFRPALQALGNYVRDEAATIRAVPIAGPNDLHDQWKYGLADELALGEWRTPQVIIHNSRSNAWKDSIVGTTNKTEAVFRREESQELYERVIAVLEEYDPHLFAKSDRVPWDLRRRKPAAPGAAQHLRHPCCLPIPPKLSRVPFNGFIPELREIRSWEIDGKYYFLPREDWLPNGINKKEWRHGRTFPHDTCPHCGKQFPIDRKRQVWCWDETHRHWDVQLVGGGYWSISHDGRLIQKKDKIKRKKLRGRRR